MDSKNVNEELNAMNTNQSDGSNNREIKKVKTT